MASRWFLDEVKCSYPALQGPSWSALSISAAVFRTILPVTSVNPSRLLFYPSNKQHFLLNAWILASLYPLLGISPTQIYIILLIFT